VPDDKPVPPLATGSVPVTPVVNGKPVRLVSVPLEGTPSTALLAKVATPVTVRVPVKVVAPVTFSVSPEAFPRMVLPVDVRSTTVSAPVFVIPGVVIPVVPFNEIAIFFSLNYCPDRTA
jgi:hypothetical protein